jgi:hypothetical protein
VGVPPARLGDAGLQLAGLGQCQQTGDMFAMPVTEIAFAFTARFGLFRGQIDVVRLSQFAGEHLQPEGSAEIGV